MFSRRNLNGLLSLFPTIALVASIRTSRTAVEERAETAFLFWTGGDLSSMGTQRINPEVAFNGFRV
jgi:hypothetical protein